MVHGGRDHCRNWDWVAEALRDDYHIIAPDLRGHGDSQWAVGSTYNHVDYVYDIAQLIHQKKMGPVTIIAHSMGGGVSLTYAGLYPETVEKLVVIEGMGPPPEMIRDRINVPVHARLDNWVQDLRKSSGRLPRRYPTLEEAYERMQTENPHLTEEQARHLTIHGSNQNEDGTYSWKFDNYMRNFSPIGLPFEAQYELWNRISCPTLLVRGTESWASDPSKDGRADHFQDVKVVNVENAGHWVHHDQLDEFLSLTRDFLAG
jgi:pimeloyl-ACP methyl ester carboxylesterase